VITKLREIYCLKMTISRAFFCLVLLIVVSRLSFAQSGPVRQRQVSPGSAQTQNQGESTIRGRATFSDSGELVAKARVTLTSRGQSGRLRATVTDERGEFQFERVAAGDYNVIVHTRNELLPNAAAFRVPLPTGDPATDEANFEAMTENASKVSVDGTNSVYVEVRVARKSGGTVSGRVTYANGKPASRSRVSFFNKRDSGSPSMARYSVEANDKGVYLIKGLPPGQYIVSASQPPDSRQPVGSSAGSLAPTYFPSAFDAGNSTPVTVLADQETADINVILLERSLHKIAGTVKLRRNGQPVAGVMVRLVKNGDAGQLFATPIPAGIESGSGGGILMAGRSGSMGNIVELGSVGPPFGNLAPTDAQGRWSFSNIPDGEYTIVVGSTVMGMPSPRSGGPILRGPGRSAREADRLPEKQQAVTLAGSDVKNLSIEISEGGTVSGVVEVEGGLSLPPRVLVTSQLNLEERRPAAVAEVQSDGTFTMTGVPEGEVFLGALFRPANAFYVRSVEANGAELPQGQLKVEDGKEIRGVRIVLSSDVAGLTGRVLSSAGGSPVAGAIVMLVPMDRDSRVLPHATLMAPALGDGRFMIGGPPGEYFAVVIRLSDGPPPQDLESIKALTNGAPRVTLRSGERQSMDLIAPAK
jgi:Carboxypeptidase regulatory-like domain